MADMTEEEMEQKKGLLADSDPAALIGGRRFEIPQGTNVKSLPDVVDWSKSGEMWKHLKCKVKRPTKWFGRNGQIILGTGIY